MPKIKFAFFGTPEIAAETLEILKNNGFFPALIVTSPDRSQGRHMILTPPPVKIWAEKNNILVLQPEKLDKNLIIESFDLFIVVAYGKIFPEWLINMPRHGTVNIHYSLLPKYRGASPVQTAILNGDSKTGVTIQKMVKELDAGPIIAQEKVAINPDEKTPELLERLTKVGGELLAQTLPDYVEGKILLKEQDHSQATSCRKIKKEDGLIPDPRESALGPRESAMLYNKFRAFFEWPRTYFIRDNPLDPARGKQRIIIADAKMENGKFKIKKILPEGKNEIAYSDK